MTPRPIPLRPDDAAQPVPDDGGDGDGSAASREAPAGLATRQVHAGYTPGIAQNTVAVPVYQSVAYRFDSFAAARETFALSRPGNIYSRNGNPTNAVLERRVNDLEGGAGARQGDLLLMASNNGIDWAISDVPVLPRAGAGAGLHGPDGP